MKVPYIQGEETDSDRDRGVYPQLLTTVFDENTTVSNDQLRVKCNFYPFKSSPSSYFSSQPVLHDWFSKDRAVCYPVCGMMHIKEPLYSEGVEHVAAAGFLSCYFSGPSTICLTP